MKEAAAPQPTVDETALAQILAFGFSENACRRAVRRLPHTCMVSRAVCVLTTPRLLVSCQLLATNNNVEAAGAWLMDHMGDADFNDPIAPAAGAAAAGGSAANAESVSMLVAMLGVSERHAAKALEATGNSVERAADWALSHPDLPDEPSASGGGEESKAPEYDGRYQLKAVVSHIGTTTTGGHYVCHVKKDGVWAFFNDASVAKSEDPPITTGFMYLYEAKQ